MNGRIQELARQCRWENYGVNGELLSSGIDEEKFAELLIRECISMADEFEMNVNRSGLVDRMKEHFGVEE